MSKDKFNKLAWGQRFRIIEAYELTDTQICEVMDLHQDELSYAREKLDQGIFKIDRSFDISSYESEFNIKPKTVSITRPENAPQSATKTIKVPKKRGRKGSNIKVAFEAVPIGKASAVSVEDFSQEHNVSIAVLRQSKRFDINEDSDVDNGKVHVKRDENKTLVIWRDDINSQEIKTEE